MANYECWDDGVDGCIVYRGVPSIAKETRASVCMSR